MTLTPVPLPAPILLLGSALGMLGLAVKRKTRIGSQAHNPLVSPEWA